MATGEEYVCEAEDSARSFKAQMPDVPCGLIADDASLVAADTPFDDVLTLTREPEFSFYDRIPALKDSPYERTLYLDTDTRCIAPCEELFDLLDRFEVAAAHAPWRLAHASFTDFADWYDTTVCPLAFPELNCGVILYQGGARLDALVDAWEARYLAHREASGLGRRCTDQPSFREALYESDVNLTILPPEYNVRTPFPYFVGGNSQAKILHGRPPSLDLVAEEINRSSRPRSGGIPSNYWIWRKVSTKVANRARALRGRVGAG